MRGQRLQLQAMPHYLLSALLSTTECILSHTAAAALSAPMLAQRYLLAHSGWHTFTVCCPMELVDCRLDAWVSSCSAQAVQDLLRQNVGSVANRVVYNFCCRPALARQVRKTCMAYSTVTTPQTACSTLAGDSEVF